MSKSSATDRSSVPCHNDFLQKFAISCILFTSHCSGRRRRRRTCLPLERPEENGRIAGLEKELPFLVDDEREEDKEKDAGKCKTRRTIGAGEKRSFCWIADHSVIQSWSKKWAKGCVLPRPSRGDEFTQPLTILCDHPCLWRLQLKSQLNARMCTV